MNSDKIVHFIDEYVTRVRRTLRNGGLTPAQRARSDGELYALAIVRDTIRRDGPDEKPPQPKAQKDQHTITSMSLNARVSDQVVRYILRSKGFKPIQVIGRTHLYSDDAARTVMESAGRANRGKYA